MVPCWGALVIGAVYMLRSYQFIMLGDRNDSNIAFGPLAGTDKVVLIVICGAILFFGVYPKPLNDLAEQGTRMILEQLK